MLSAALHPHGGRRGGIPLPRNGSGSAAPAADCANGSVRSGIPRPHAPPWSALPHGPGMRRCAPPALRAASSRCWPQRRSAAAALSSAPPSHPRARWFIAGRRHLRRFDRFSSPNTCRVVLTASTRRSSHPLREGRRVLFTGTPCQIAGLHALLRGARPEGLLTAECLCHGVPSPGLWRRYLREISGGRRILRIDFRDKKPLGMAALPLHGVHGERHAKHPRPQGSLHEGISPGADPCVRAATHVPSSRGAAAATLRCAICGTSPKRPRSSTTTAAQALFWRIPRRVPPTSGRLTPSMPRFPMTNAYAHATAASASRWRHTPARSFFSASWPRRAPSSTCSAGWSGRPANTRSCRNSANSSTPDPHKTNMKIALLTLPSIPTTAVYSRPSP